MQSEKDPDTTNLTDPQYWDHTWTEVNLDLHHGSLRKYLFEPQADRQLWRKILPQALPAHGNGLKMIELGSAPGRNLLPWKQQFGFGIYGADFSETGLEVQRRLFASLDLDESHTIHADFLDPAFLQAHAATYDVVYSAGLIEHFTDPQAAVDAHVAILKPGGMLVVSIPNIAGMYRHLIAREVVDRHNLSIMRLPAFCDLFKALKPSFCGYYGGINLGLAFGEGSSLLYKLLPSLQILINVGTRLVPVPENSVTSPYLLFVGKKSEGVPN